jgi:hypothetical protein
VPVIERGEGCFDDFKGQAVEKLFVFIRALEARQLLADQR